jgi:DNA-binding CsgD family transcriptional regulator
VIHTLEEVPVFSDALLQVARLLVAAEPVRAARLAGARAALVERTGIHAPQRMRERVKQLRADLATRLGSEQAQRQWSEGERLSSDEVVTLALEGERSSSANPGGLSARELEVSRLVADGLTSQQVAATLHLSTRTVDSHLGRIFTKVGVSNRLQQCRQRSSDRTTYGPYRVFEPFRTDLWLARPRSFAAPRE